jgi:hypothetical protein
MDEKDVGRLMSNFNTSISTASLDENEKGSSITSIINEFRDIIMFLKKWKR